MLPNKNNMMSSFNMSSLPNLGYGQIWVLRFNTLYSLVMWMGIGICLWAAHWQFNKAQHFATQPIHSSTLTGQFLNDHTRLLDNQTLDGHAGYAVVTPFKTKNELILVNRGFIPLSNRQEIPAVPVVTGVQSIEGHYYSIKKPFMLSTNRKDAIPQRIQFIDSEFFDLQEPISDLSKAFQMKHGEGLLMAFQAQPPYLSEHRHLAYALQWILLALAGLCVWLVASIKKNKKKEA